jgi:hypothetical protein
VLPQTWQSDKQEIILDASDYHLLAQGDWGVDSSRPSPDIETAILKELNTYSTGCADVTGDCGTASPPSWSTNACSMPGPSSARDMCGTASRRSF